MYDRLKDFLNELILTDEQQKEVYRRFCAEVRKGLAKATRPQADTKCYVTYVQDLPTGEEKGQYLALDLGGSNFRVLLVTLRAHHEATIESKVYSLSNEIITGPGKGLFDHIAACLADFVKETKVNGQLPLGFTFSFPCVQKGLTSAYLVRWTKGFSCSGVVNEDVGRLLKEAIERRGDTAIDVVAILNDTTGTLMSCAHRNPACRIGLIIGTGCNACYVENVNNAELLESEYRNKKHVIINVEWGAFGDGGALDFIKTDYDRKVDENSPNKGHQIFEKMIAGMYLGELVRLVLISAIREHLIFDLSTADVLLRILYKKDCLETKHISKIETDTKEEIKHTQCVIKEVFGIEEASAMDCRKLRFICQVISKRAAFLAGIGLSGLINKINEPVAIVGIDGTVYRLHPMFDSYMRMAMQKLIEPKIKFDLMLSEDGSGRGAALVAAVASEAYRKSVAGKQASKF